MTTPEFPDTNIPAPQGPKPDVRRMKTEDYLNMLADMYGQQAVILAEIERRTRQASSRSAVIRIPFSAGGTRSDDVPLPQGDWRTAIISVQAGKNASGVIPFVSGMLFPPVTDMAVLPIVNQSPLHVEAATTFAATGFVNVLLSNQPYPLSGADGAYIQGLGTNGTPAGGVVTVQGAMTTGSLPILYGSPVVDGVAAYRGATGGGAGTGLMGVGLTLYDPSSGGWNPQRVPSSPHSIASVAVTAGTPQSIWTPAVGKSFRLMVYDVSLSVAGSIIFKDGPVGGPYVEIWRTPKLVANTPHPVPPGFGNGILSAAVNNQLWIDVTATGTVDGGVFGTEE